MKFEAPEAAYVTITEISDDDPLIDIHETVMDYDGIKSGDEAREGQNGHPNSLTDTEPRAAATVLPFLGGDPIP